MGEATLVSQAKSGDKDALVELIMRRKNEYYRLAYVYMGNQEDAMDALQDMIVVLYENIRKLKKLESFHAWAKTILVNTCKGQLKKRYKMIPFEEIAQVAFARMGSFTETSVQDASIDLREGLKKLNEYQKEAIVLKYFLDLDYETIGKITKTPVGTVKSRVFNGLKHLKQVLEGGC